MAAYDELLGFINELQIIDSHEHLPPEAQRDQNSDVLSEWLFHYFSCDLISAGMSDDAMGQVRDPKQPLAKRWKIVQPFWDAARSTGYGRSLDIAARGLYGLDGVTGKTIEPLNEAFKAARAKGGHYQYVLKDKSRIALSLAAGAVVTPYEKDFFAVSQYLDEFITPGHINRVRQVGQEVGVEIHSIEDWEHALELHLDKCLKGGAVALKCGLAYSRTLLFEKTPRAVAEEEFNRFFGPNHSAPWQPGTHMAKGFQDYMMHALLKLADARGLTFQIHTGLHEGNGNHIAHSNPVLLTNLFLEYSNVKFDIFHMSYPFIMELSNLAKNFRNVFIDMCWGHIISPEAARRAIVEWLDAVPANKITAFGGDYCFIDGVYGHATLARQNVAAALAQKIADGSFDLDRAKQIAGWMFVDTPTRIFHLEDRIKKSPDKRRK
ncbi:MAG: amidohydrolase family protein [Phycisphaerae bacterium]